MDTTPVCYNVDNPGEVHADIAAAVRDRKGKRMPGCTHRREDDGGEGTRQNTSLRRAGSSGKVGRRSLAL